MNTKFSELQRDIVTVTIFYTIDARRKGCVADHHLLVVAEVK
jgi:hypothetical protein